MGFLQLTTGMRLVWPNPVVTMEVRRMRLVAGERLNWYLAGCAIAIAAWGLAVAWAMAMEARADGSAVAVRVADLYKWHQFVVLGVLSYGVGFFTANGLVRDSIRNGESSELYFTRLSPPEIVQGKAVAAALPWVIVLAATGMISTVGLLMFPTNTTHNNVFCTWVQGLALSALLKSLALGPLAKGFLVILWFPLSLALGALGTLAGALGGIRFAIRGREKLLFSELLTQCGLAILAGLAGFQAIGFTVIFFAQVDGYDVLAREYWWHTTFIPEERPKK